jgi:hypothetical protein
VTTHMGNTGRWKGHRFDEHGNRVDLTDEEAEALQRTLRMMVLTPEIQKRLLAQQDSFYLAHIRRKYGILGYCDQLFGSGKN